MSNPIIADAPKDGLATNFSTEDNKFLEGAGIFSDAANTLTDAAGGNWASLGLDLVSDGLDFLGFVTDPFGTLGAAPIGWIIEHFGPLKEILDQVGGDPEAVRAKAQTWTNIAAALDKSAADYEASAKALTGTFTGAAATSYTKAASNYTKAVKGASSHAKSAAKAFEVAGSIVGTVRATIRDMFAQFAAHVLERGLIALASSEITFGASIAAWVLDSVGAAASVAERAASKILKAVREVMELAHGASNSTRALKAAERDLAQGPARRAAARQNLNRANSETRAAASKADAAEDGITRAQEAQARAQQHINEATTPAQREAAENELHNARAREANQRGNLAEAQRDKTAAREHRREARSQQVEGTKHEYDDYPETGEHAKTVERAERAEKGIEYGHKTVDTGKEADENANDDDRDEAGDKSAKGADDGSLV